MCQSAASIVWIGVLIFLSSCSETSQISLPALPLPESVSDCFTRCQIELGISIPDGVCSGDNQPAACAYPAICVQLKNQDSGCQATLYAPQSTLTSSEADSIINLDQLIFVEGVDGCDDTNDTEFALEDGDEVEVSLFVLPSDSLSPAGFEHCEGLNRLGASACGQDDPECYLRTEYLVTFSDSNTQFNNPQILSTTVSSCEATLAQRTRCDDTQSCEEVTACESLCPNGVTDPTEECDDNNSVDFDGCTACKLDVGFECLGDGPCTNPAPVAIEGVDTTFPSEGLLCEGGTSFDINLSQFFSDVGNDELRYVVSLNDTGLDSDCQGRNKRRGRLEGKTREPTFRYTPPTCGTSNYRETWEVLVTDSLGQTAEQSLLFNVTAVAETVSELNSIPNMVFTAGAAARGSSEAENLFQGLDVSPAADLQLCALRAGRLQEAFSEVVAGAFTFTPPASALSGPVDVEAVVGTSCDERPPQSETECVTPTTVVRPFQVLVREAPSFSIADVVQVEGESPEVTLRLSNISSGRGDAPGRLQVSVTPEFDCFFGVIDIPQEVTTETLELKLPIQSGPGAGCTEFDLAADDVNGTILVDVELSDEAFGDTVSIVQTVQVTIQPVNDPPRFDALEFEGKEPPQVEQGEEVTVRLPLIGGTSRSMILRGLTPGAENEDEPVELRIRLAREGACEATDSFVDPTEFAPFEALGCGAPSQTCTADGEDEWLCCTPTDSSSDREVFFTSRLFPEAAPRGSRWAIHVLTNEARGERLNGQSSCFFVRYE